MPTMKVYDSIDAEWKYVFPGMSTLQKTTVYFTSSGSFVKAAYGGLVFVEVEVQGGGGGGGGVPATDASTGGAGSGGSAGGYSRKRIEAASLAASETVVVGAGGSGGSGTTGGGGGDSRFGGTDNASSHCYALGGSGGGSFTTTAPPRAEHAVAGGGAGNGDLNSGGGGAGGAVIQTTGNSHGGMGGASHFGGGGNSVGNPRHGDAGLALGSGGGGAASDTSRGAFGGGAGQQGIVIVHVWQLVPVAVAQQQLVSARIKSTAHQTVSNTVWTDVQFGATEWLDGGFTIHSAGGTEYGLIVPATGLYDISAGVNWAGSASGGGRYLRLLVNDDAKARTGFAAITGSLPTDITVSTRWKCTVGDVIKASVYQSSGGSLDCYHVPNYSRWLEASLHQAN